MCKLLQKLKQCLVLILIAAFTHGIANADTGMPAIQAICKITLKNGKQIEGIIPLAFGDYSACGYKVYKSNGFCFEHDKGIYQLELFNLSVDQFTPLNYGAYRAGKSKLYYASFSNQVLRDSAIEISQDEKGKMLKRRTVELDQFRLSSEITIYRKLPLSLYVGSEEQNKDDEIRIKVTEIKSFELVKNPSKYWLGEIQAGRARLGNYLEEEIKKDQNAWPDYIEPEWYHEIINDIEKLDYYSKYFR